MEIHHAYDSDPDALKQVRMERYYSHYIVPQEKRVTPLLESISDLQSERNVPSIDSLCCADGMLAEKVFQNRTAVDFTVRQIEEREQLKERHLEEIDYAICYTTGKIWHLDQWYMGSNRGIDQARNQFHRQRQQLEQERRNVEAAAWRDEAMLMKDFVENWCAYKNDLLAYSVLTPKGSG